MRIFFSAGEPSGDVHGANLIRQLKRFDHSIDAVGLGGDQMAAAGAHLLYPLSDLAVMGVSRVLARLPTFANLICRFDRYFHRHRPDAVVLIDYPGFNWWVARRAKAHGIPVFYFVPPQLWAWLGWRVKKMRRFVDHVLCSLPFEPSWYAERGVKAHYVGHPFFDECAAQHLDPAFMDQHQRGPIVAILPGSRTQEIEMNLSTQFRAAQRIHRARPDARFLFACYKPAHQRLVQAYLDRHDPLPAEVHVGRTPEIISLARACISVSGSVALELLNRGVPTVICYRVGKWFMRLCRPLVKTKYICLVNLLAERIVYPEYLSVRDESFGISQDVLTWLNDPAQHRAVVDALAELRGKFGQAGACERTARFILGQLTGLPLAA